MSMKFAFCFDKNYVKYCSVALLSLLMSNAKGIKVYCIFDDSVLDADLSIIIELTKSFNFELVLIRIDNKVFSSYKETNHITRAAYIRLLLPDLIANEEKILYLDCDLLIINNLETLFNTDISHLKYAGILDIAGSNLTRLPEPYKRNYINSGVLLMNLHALRKDQSLEKMLSIYEGNHAIIDFHDQDLINMYALDEILILDSKYNYQVRSEIAKKGNWDSILKENSVLHFLGGTKPWHKNCRSHIADFWWHYADRLHDEQLIKIESESIYDLIIESKSLEEDGKFEESCAIKDRIIAKLNNNQYFNNQYFNISE